MTEQATKLERTSDVSRGFIARYGLMYLGQNIAWAAPSNLLLANQILAWFPDSKEAMLGWLMSAGGLVGMFASPAAGYLSDRTRSRFGRRTPWVLGGALGAAAALLLAAFAGTFGVGQAAIGFGVLVVAWMIFQFAIALTITPTQSIVPDRVPQHQFGIVSGVMGMTYTAAIVLGTAIAAAVGGWGAYVGIVVVLVVAIIPFLVVDKEQPYREPKTRVESATKSSIRQMFPRPRQYPDFWWMLATRGLLTLAQAIALFYLLYFLRDRVRYSDPDGGVLILTLVFAVCVVVTAIWSGWLSDRIGRRKPFVSGASIGVAAACLLLAFVDTFALVVVAATVLGLSWGVYQAIDQALVNEVLPSEAERATHMGVINLGVAIPNTLAPLIAAGAVAALGGYAGLYILAAALAVIGGLFVLRIRGAR